MPLQFIARRNPRVRIILALLTWACQSFSAFAGNGSVVYTYDALGRVLTASYDTGAIIIYAYDPNGNRTQQLINVNSALAVWNSFSWDAALWH